MPPHISFVLISPKRSILSHKGAMRYALFALSLIFVSNCSKPDFRVSQFHLRGPEMLRSGSQSVRAEALFRYDHNLSAKDREQKHGHYYVFRWKHGLIDQSGSALQLTFTYRQASSGKTGKTITQTIEANSTPQYEIAVNGSDYLQNGRILAWKATLSQDGKVIGTEQSFLWD